MMPDSAKRKTINPRFAEQRADEAVLVETRRHFWVFLRSAWLPMLLLAALLLAATQVQAAALKLGLLGLALLLPGAVLVYLIMEWRNDSVIVTDQRIIRINRKLLTMQRHIAQIGMESVHEINIEIPAGDIFARLLRYGTVIVKTAGAQGNMKLELMPTPERLQRLVLETRKGYAEQQAQRHGQMVRAEMQRWLLGDVTEDDLRAQMASNQPLQPLRGSNGYLSARIEMSNGDIVYRKHISVWFRHTTIPLAIMLISLAGLVLTFAVVAPDMRIVTFPIAMLALLVSGLAYYWLDWDWRNDIYILSDDTITLVHKRPFFLQNLRDQILIERIDNVESSMSGFISALLQVGDVRMSLVGADEPKLFTRVHKPAQIQQEISRRQHNKARRRAHYDAMQQRQILGEYLTVANGAAHAANPAAAAQRELPSSSASNSDCNRPPRLPRKLTTGQSAANTDSSLTKLDKPRPPRFRS
ncbi:MAG: PH domain-containing protein [Chloroflexi bacterium]|nr:PH domain-containing protein [Chloroflexota bacterium]